MYSRGEGNIGAGVKGGGGGGRGPHICTVPQLAGGRLVPTWHTRFLSVCQA